MAKPKGRADRIPALGRLTWLERRGEPPGPREPERVTGGLRFPIRTGSNQSGSRGGLIRTGAQAPMRYRPGGTDAALRRHGGCSALVPERRKPAREGALPGRMHYLPSARRKAEPLIPVYRVGRQDGPVRGESQLYSPMPRQMAGKTAGRRTAGERTPVRRMPRKRTMTDRTPRKWKPRKRLKPERVPPKRISHESAPRKRSPPALIPWKRLPWKRCLRKRSWWTRMPRKRGPLQPGRCRDIPGG
jgi:hypothetical protein